MPLFFAVTLFISAFLLFLVQPLVGKMLLPLMGGTPVVWNTCMVFFQAMLLGGYLYSHASTKYLSVRRQTFVHMGLLVLTLLVLATAAVVMGQPISVSSSLSPQGDRIPVFGMLLVLFLAVGLPFFTVATSAPLLQRWFSGTGHRSAKDPYFLYGASNLGSVLAMVAYPLVMEPNLRLASQSWVWSAGFFALAVMIACCGWVAWKSPMAVGLNDPRPTAASRVYEPAPPVTWPQRLRWIMLAFVPSSLMLGVTTYLVTDIASMPLLWIIPLGLYLITFIIAFPPLPGGTQLPKSAHTMLTLVSPVLILLVIFLMLSGIKISNAITFSLHLVAFFAVALTCHNELARNRPSAARLTEFFLLVSVGGVLGGLFNALVAPLIFDGVHEYKVALAVACLALPVLPNLKDLAEVAGSDASSQSFFDRWLTRLLAAIGLKSEPHNDQVMRRLRILIVDILAMILVLGLVLLLVRQANKDPQYKWGDYPDPVAWWRRPAFEIAYAISYGLNWLGNELNRGWVIGSENLFKVIKFGFPALVCYLFVERPWRFGLCVAVLLVTFHAVESRWDNRDVIFQKRSFFGVLRIDEENYTSASGLTVYHQLIHGTTIHGREKVLAPDPDEVGQPISYYHPRGPIGDIFNHIGSKRVHQQFAVIGLGTGTLARWAKPGQHVVYYEIDPLVKRIAEDPRYFTYLTDLVLHGGSYEILMGDARVQMKLRTNDRYGMIFVDAFSSDSIPVHLLTRESIQLYFDRLLPDGVLILHISNRYLDLKPVVRKLAENLNLIARVCEDGDGEDKSGSHWVVVTRRPEHIGKMAELHALAEWHEKDFEELLAAPGRRFGIGACGGGMPTLKTRERWKLMVAKPDDPLWTDDFSNILRIIIWR